MKNVLVFVAGAIVGGIAGYLVAKSMAKRAYEIELTNKMCEFMKEDESKEKTEIKDEEKSDDISEEEKQIVTEEVKEEYMNYVKKYNEETEPEWAGPTELSDAEKELLLPYLITEQEYYEDGWDGKTYYWFTEEQCMRDEDGNIVDDWEAAVGLENVELLQSEEYDVEMFVRNEKDHTDYNVINEAMFSRRVGGHNE